MISFQELLGRFLIQARDHDLPPYFPRWFRDAVEECSACGICEAPAVLGAIYLLTKAEEGRWDPLPPFAAFGLCERCAGRSDIDARLRSKLILFEPVEGRPQ